MVASNVEIVFYVHGLTIALWSVWRHAVVTVVQVTPTSCGCSSSRLQMLPASQQVVLDDGSLLFEVTTKRPRLVLNKTRRKVQGCSVIFVRTKKVCHTDIKVLFISSASVGSVMKAHLLINGHKYIIPHSLFRVWRWCCYHHHSSIFSPPRQAWGHNWGWMFWGQKHACLVYKLTYLLLPLCNTSENSNFNTT